MRSATVLTFAVFALAACRQASPPAPSAPTQPGPGPAVSQAVQLDMPLAPGDAGTAVYSIWPFGVHGGGHAFDGHPGWDLEFRPGTTLRAPAAGIVTTVMPDPNSPALFTIQIEHGAARRHRTNYTSLASLAPGIVGGATVTAGQPLGVPATVTAMIGPRQVTWAMTLFQFDDFDYNVGQTNPFARNPADALSPAGRAAFDAIWAAAAYYGELTEPFAGNPRDVAFPLTRSWTRESGGLAARIDFTRATPTTSDYTYVMFAADGTVVEQGAVAIDPNAPGGSTIDFLAGTGGIRRGLWNIVSGAMQLDYGAPAAPRPATLGAASTYGTR